MSIGLAWQRQWQWCVSLGPSLDENSSHHMGGGWPARGTLTVRGSARGCLYGIAVHSWIWHPCPPTSRHNIAGQTRPVPYHQHFLSSRQHNTGWTSCGLPRPSTAIFRGVLVGIPVALTYVWISFTDTWIISSSSLTVTRVPTPGSGSVICSYPGRQWRQYISALECVGCCPGGCEYGFTVMWTGPW